jgi:hypothetical protein
MLALPLSEYERMSMTGKSRTAFALVEFVCVQNSAEAGLPPFTAPSAIDMRELEPDDEIDGINVQPKVRSVTDFLTKPVIPKIRVTL